MKNTIKLFILALIFIIGLSFYASFISLDFFIFSTFFTYVFLRIGVEFERKNKILLIIGLSVFLLITGQYYQYFNKYLYIAFINQLKFITLASGSIAALISVKTLIFVLAIGFISYFYITIDVIDDDFQLNKTLSILLILTLIISPNVYGNIVKGFNISFTLDDQRNEQVQEEPPSVVSKNYYGIAKDTNLLVIQLESFQNFLIDLQYNGQEVTPTINDFIDQSDFYFDNYYSQVGMGNTADAEFVSNNSLYPIEYNSVYDQYTDNFYQGLPKLLKARGYDTIAFHGNNKEFWNRNKAYPFQGIDTFYSQEDFQFYSSLGLGVADETLFRQGVQKLNNHSQPFYGFMITISQHFPYKIPEAYQSLTLKDKHDGTIVGNYLQLANYVDRSFKVLIDQLKKEGYLNNTTIVLYGDHHGINAENEAYSALMGELLNQPYNYDEMMKVPLVIETPDRRLNIVNSGLYGQIDFLPTMMNLYGITEDETFHLGIDALNNTREYLPFISYIPRGSYFTKTILYKKSPDNIFTNDEVISLKTGESLENNNLYYEMSQDVLEVLDYSQEVLSEDQLYQLIQQQNNNHKKNFSGQ